VLQRSSTKGKENVEQPVLGGEDAQSSVAKEVIKIDNNDVVMGDCFKGPVIINDSTQAHVGNISESSQPRANDHEASLRKLDPKYHQPRWCPGGLTHTKKRKDQESERQRDEFFNKLHPMVPQQQWRAKAISEALKETRVEAAEEQ
jgi:hypothetical protein